MSPVGLARFATLRSWLSQWSYDEAHGDGVTWGRDIAVPVLVSATKWVRTSISSPAAAIQSAATGRSAA